MAIRTMETRDLSSKISCCIVGKFGVIFSSNYSRILVLVVDFIIISNFRPTLFFVMKMLAS